MKKCVKCGLSSLVKNWKRNGLQRYKCKKCWAYCWWKVSRELDFQELYDLFCFQNRTYEQLKSIYKVSLKTIQKCLDWAIFKKRKFQSVHQPL